MTNDNQFEKEKKNLMIMLGLAWVVCIVLIASLAVPFTLKIYKTKDELDKARLNLDSIKSDIANSEKYLSLRESIGQSKELLERAVLKESTVVNFIQDLEDTAKDTGNSIEIAPYTPPKTKKKASSEEKTQDKGAKSESPQSKTTASPAAPDKKNESKAGQYFMLTLTGGYPQLLNFIAKLENMGYVFQLESIESKTKAGDNNIFFQDIQKGKEKSPGNIESKIVISFSLQK